MSLDFLSLFVFTIQSKDLNDQYKPARRYVAQGFQREADDLAQYLTDCDYKVSYETVDGPPMPIRDLSDLLEPRDE